MEIDLEELAKFLVRAKTKGWAADAEEVEVPQRPGFKETKPYVKDDLEYIDSYTGFFFAPGQEVVRYKGVPIWVMSYSGGMLPDYRDIDFAKKTFTFLKKALLLVEESRPFRGPPTLEEGDFKYINQSEGDITNFIGREKILCQDKEVFKQYYMGGLVLHKE